MIPYLGCDGARDMLEAFVDGELVVEAQVGIEAHLRWCDGCRARVDDLRTVGSALRLGAAAAGSARAGAASTAVLRDGLLARLGAERAQSLAVRCREGLADTRYLWPACGATIAVLLCVWAAAAVSRIVRVERPGSMAALISVLASPGSDRNPLHLDSAMLAPRTVAGGPALEWIPEEEAEFAVAAVVTREGRVANSELLQAVREQGGPPRAAGQADDVATLMGLVSRSRFEPAQAGGDPVAVNVVWLLARTTVKASIRAGEPMPTRSPGAGGVSDPLEEPVPRPARS